MTANRVKEIPLIVPRLGIALRRRRSHVGLTLSTVAKKTKLSLGYISQLELGMSSPSLDTLSRLCAVLELTFVQLFHLADIQDKFEDLERGALTKIPEIPS